MSGWVTAAVFIAGAVVTLDSLVRLLGSLSRRTVGRWLDARGRLDRLAANMHVSYFASVLGAPVLKRTLQLGAPYGPVLTEQIYRGLGYYVQAMTDADDRVVIYTVTMRDRRLKAKVPIPNKGQYSIDAKPVKLTLGRARFTDLHLPWEPAAVLASQGARRAWYIEAYYLANPGNYQTLVVSWNDASPIGGYPLLVDALIPFDNFVDATKTPAFLGSPSAEGLRRKTTINSYGITAPNFTLPFDRQILGVDLDTVRVLGS